MHFKADDEWQVGRSEGVIFYRLAHLSKQDLFGEREAVEYTWL